MRHFEDTSLPLSPTPRWLTAFLIGGALMTALALGMGLMLSPGGLEQWFAENGPVEYLQAGMVLIASAIFAYLASRSRRMLFALALVAASLLFIAALRETPRCGSDYYPGGLCLEGSWKHGATALAALLIPIGISFRWREIRAGFSFSAILSFWPLGLSALILAPAEFSEKLGWVAFEEILELISYLLALSFALVLLGKPTEE